MDVTTKQLEKMFLYQVQMHSGLGQDRMTEILNNYFATQPHRHHPTTTLMPDGKLAVHDTTCVTCHRDIIKNFKGEWVLTPKL